jgi:predicted PurR-regulated permease PerM/GAF domain-containing protein
LATTDSSRHLAASGTARPGTPAGRGFPETTPGPDRPVERRGSWLGFAAGLTLVVAVLYVGRGVLIPLAIAILLSFLLSPLVTRLYRWHVPRVPAVLLTALAAFLVIGALALLLGVQATQLATELPSYQTNLVSKLRGLQDAAPGGGAFDRLSEMFRTLRAEVAAAAPEAPASDADEVPVVQVQEAPRTAFDIIRQFAAPLLGPVGKAGIVIVLVIFMLLEREDLRNRLIRLLGPNLNVTTEVLDEAGSRVSRYLLMQLVVNVTYGIPFGVGLYFIGIPNAFLWAALAIVLRFIPYLGPVLSAAFPVLLALAIDPGWTTVLLTLGLILVLELISNNFIEPWLYGASTSMSAVAIILAAIFWTSLWGPIGLLLATPLTVCLAVSGRYFPQLRFLDVLLGSAPALSLPERLYQRLLAGDVDEAERIAEAYLDDHSLGELYDEVALPALWLAATDNARRGLSAERRLVVTRTALELIGELADREEADGEAPAADGGALITLPQAEPKAVLCAAGRSGLDLAVATMLGQLLERRGFRSRVVSAEALSPEHLPACRIDDVAAVCLSYVDRSATPRAQQTARRLSRHRPQKPVLIGLWNLTEEQRRRIARLPDSARIVGNLREALQCVYEITTPADREFTAAPIPLDEQERLYDLRALHALDASDERLVQYTRRLSEAFGVPISLLNLVDEQCQHFKGQTGLPDDLARAGKGPRETSICGHVVAENDVMIVEDALNDPRFAKNPFLLEHGIRFYAGAPLRSRRGHAIGSLCVIDASPRTVTDEEKALLLSVAQEAMAELEAAASAGPPPRGAPGTAPDAAPGAAGGSR